jgi:O-succinylbenzoate synthase
MHGGNYEFRRIRRRFRKAIVTGSGTVDAVDRVVIRTETEGRVGFGEVAPWPGFPTESADEAAEALRSAQGDLARLISKVASRPMPALAAALSSCRRWNEIASFEGALPCAGLVTAGEDVREKAARGHRTLKMKIGPGDGTDLARAALDRFPGVLRLDANGSLDLAAARLWTEYARSETRVEFLEQPLPVGHAGYASLGCEKVALDESFTTPDGPAWAGPSVVKPSLAGDWDAFLTWRGTRTAPVVYSSCFETAIGRQAGLWLASLDPAPLAVGFDTLGRFELDGRDRHEDGPFARGLGGLDWEKFWRELA